MCALGNTVVLCLATLDASLLRNQEYSELHPQQCKDVCVLKDSVGTCKHPFFQSQLQDVQRCT